MFLQNAFFKNAVFVITMETRIAGDVDVSGGWGNTTLWSAWSWLGNFAGCSFGNGVLF